MDTKDLAFIAQNSGGHAADITAALIAAGQVDQAGATHVFTALREDIFNGALELVGTTVEGVQAEVEAAAEARAVKAAEKAFADAPRQASNTSAPAAAPSGGRVKVKKLDEALGVPDWLEKQVEWMIGEGKIADTNVVEVWDNRRFLPENGGDRSPKGPHFATVNKMPGEQYGTGIWPPKRG